MTDALGDRRIWRVLTLDRDGQTPIKGVREQLEAGRAVIGWSYKDDFDLRKLRDRHAAGETFDHAESEAFDTHHFLDVAVGDLLIYTHQPRRDVLLVAEVTGGYDYSASGNIRNDFRSFVPCRLLDRLATPHDVLPKLPTRGRFVEVQSNRDEVAAYFAENFEVGA